MSKRRLKLIMQMLAAFLIALFAYNLLYEPHQESVRAAVQQNAPLVAEKSLDAAQKIKAAASAELSTLKSAAEGGAEKFLPQNKNAGTQNPVPEGKLRITVLDVGQGDAILLDDGKRKVMVDVGDSRKDAYGGGGREALLRSLAKAGVRENADRIDTVIITHHHSDHMGNSKWLAGKFKVRNIYDNAIPNPKNPDSWLNKELRAGHYHNRVLRAGEKVELGRGYFLDVLSPGDFLTPKELQDFNNTSIVMKLHYGNFSMLLMGDAEAPVEDYLQKRYGADLAADVLKVGHHGSRTSSIYKFISKARPRYALISCGNPNIFHHPHKNVTGSLAHLGAQVWTTYEHGNLTIITDGRDFRVEKER